MCNAARPFRGFFPAAVRRRGYLAGSVHPARGLDVSQSASPDAVIQRPPPYDASTFAPTGELSAAERAWTARLYHPHHLALAWRLLGRDADGNLVAGTIVSCGRDTAHQRHCYMTFTAAGVVHRDAIVPIDVDDAGPVARD